MSKMSKMEMQLKKLGALVLALALTASLLMPSVFAAEDKTPDPAPTRQASAQQAIEYAAKYGNATSVQYALWEEGEITLSGHTGVYSKTENRALTNDTMYGIGSVSKIYTATAVMQLVEAEKINLDDPVTKYLPEFKMVDERYKQITVRMLLNHSAGFMGSSMSSGMLFDDSARVATEDLLNRLSAQRLKAAPGAFSVYCNDGFTLAELVVERVSAMDFSSYVHKRILGPNDLKATYTPADDFDRSLLAKIYYSVNDRALPTDTLGVVGTGGIYATSADLATFGGLFCSTDMLTQNSLDAMATPECDKGLWPQDSTDDALAYGLGWDNVRVFPFGGSGIRALAKAGDTSYYHSGLVVLPKYKMAVAVQSSGGLSTFNEMAATRILIDALSAKGVKVDETEIKLPESKASVPPKTELAKAGFYASTTAGVVQIELATDGKLTMSFVTLSGSAPQIFTYRADGTYRDAENTILLKLVTEKNGKTYFYQKNYGAAPGLGQSPIAEYVLQKLEKNELSGEVTAAWQARSEKLYLSVNERYTSQAYAFIIPAAGVAMDPKVPGYVASNRITDVDTAEFVLQIPGVGSRDGSDIRFFEKDGLEYLNYRSGLYVDSAAAKNIYIGTNATCTIQSDGHARWYRTGSLTGKTINVAVPPNGAFYVYDADGIMTAGSWVNGDDSAVLPKDGYIVFAGAPGTQFRMTLAAQ